MKKIRYMLLIVPFIFSGESLAGTINVNLPKVNLTGGLSATAIREDHTDEGTKSDIKLTDALLDLSSDEDYGGFDVAIGTMTNPVVSGSVDNDNSATVGNNFGLIWGYATIKPMSRVKLSAGYLPTNVGYELPFTFSNDEISYGLIWNSQPFIYKGVRISYDPNDSLEIYSEYDRGDELNGGTNDHASGLGAIGSIRNLFSYTLNYFDYGNYKNLIDLTLSKKISNISFGTNADYQWLDDDSGKKGYGIALYIKPEFDRFSLPARVEYVKDKKNSGIYGFNDRGTYSLTVTPTYKLSDHTTARAELATVKSNDDDAFSGSKRKTSATLQISFTF